MKKLLGLTFLVSSSLFASIYSYKEINGCFIQEKREYALLRAFKKEQKAYYLVVNTKTLQTKIVPQSNFFIKKCSNSYYKKLLNISTEPPYPLHNDGLTTNNKGITITTDLCPSSKKGFEKELYEALFKNFSNPAPVTLFITKRWILKHKKEFNLLKSWQKEQKLAITWGNHTAYHHYHPKADDSKNYVLSPNENLKQDIFDLEKALIENGVTPSIFFRFPGLVSNKTRVEQVKKLGLIVIGANAWLAIGQKVGKNSIILVHGNRNEPTGIKMLLRLIKEKKIKKIFSLF